MSCLYCNDPNNHPRNICPSCLMTEFGSPYDSDLKRAEAWRQKREQERAANGDKKCVASEIEPEQWVDGRWAK